MAGAFPLLLLTLLLLLLAAWQGLLLGRVLARTASSFYRLHV
jgi:hypothetical protein